MEEGVAAAVDRIDAAAQIVPVADFVHRLVADDLFQNVRRRRPVYPAQHEKSPVEPGRQQMHDVAVERCQILVALHQRKQIGAHRHQFAGAARRAVEPADQFLPPRLGGKMQIAGVGVARLRAPALDRLRQPFAVGTVIAGQRLRRTQAGRRRRGRDSGRAPRAPSRCPRPRRGPTAAPRTVRAVRRRPACVSEEEPRRSSVRPRSEIVDSRSEKKALAMGRVDSEVMPNLTGDLRRGRS